MNKEEAELFRTVVDVPAGRSKLSYETPSLWMGSCFTENIGSRFKRLKFPCEVNPFGVLYNPFSIKNSLDILMERRLFSLEDLHYHNDLWHSFYHHTSFSDPDPGTCLSNINKHIDIASDFLEKSRFLFITFGTARLYRLKDSGVVVSNNHKLPHKRFVQELMELGDIVEKFSSLIGSLEKFNPHIELVFTVSPVRHWKDGAAGNQVSKATLLLAIAKLTEMFENVTYFPAYEIVMDELRDYRFYSGDMLHINDQGTGYIFKRFMESFIEPSSLSLVNEIESIYRGIGHKPFNPSVPAYKIFLKKTLERIYLIEKSDKGIDFSGEKEELEKDIRKL